MAACYVNNQNGTRKRKEKRINENEADVFIYIYKKKKKKKKKKTRYEKHFCLHAYLSMYEAFLMHLWVGRVDPGKLTRGQVGLGEKLTRERLTRFPPVWLLSSSTVTIVTE